MDPKSAIEVSNATFDLFRRDYLIASVVVLLLVNGVWAWAFSRVWNQLNRVQDRRVQDHIDGEARASALLNRMAVHLDKNTEATTMMLMEAQARAKRRRKDDPP